MAAMAPPPVPSLAASTPSTLLLSAVRACVISVCALSGLQSGVSYSLAMVTLPSRTLWAPCLKSLALLSVGEPLMKTTLALALPLRAVRSALPWSWPTLALSNDT